MGETRANKETLMSEKARMIPKLLTSSRSCLILVVELRPLVVLFLFSGLAAAPCFSTL